MPLLPLHTMLFLFVLVDDGWSLFARVKFKPNYLKQYEQTFLVPEFDEAIRAYEGKEISVRGHYLPIEVSKNSIVVSKFPYASCFFCGGGGPESVVEVAFLQKPRKFKTDEIIIVKGKLKLNSADVDHMNFILTEAELLFPN